MDPNFYPDLSSNPFFSAQTNPNSFFNTYKSNINFDPASFGESVDLNDASFDETFLGEPTSQILSCVAEQTIIQTIHQTSSRGTWEFPAEENAEDSAYEENELSHSALRFVRHLLSWSRAAKHGFLPNFGNSESLRLLAREYIQSCGGGSQAIRQMMDSME